MKNNFLKEEKTILIFAIIALLSLIYLSSKTCAVWEECQDDSECGQYQSCDGGYCAYYTGASECLFDSTGQPFCQFYKTKGYPECTGDPECSVGGGGGDPCDGVSCGSCQYCSGGNCYDYCSGTSSSCGCTSCTSCGSCRYCSGTSCYKYCSGSDTKCGCTSCTNCNAKDKCDGPYLDDYYCKGTSCDYTHELNTDCAGFASDIVAMSNFYNGEIPIVLLNISNPYSLATGELTLFVHDEDGALFGSCNQVISLTDTKLFYGTSVKDAHFYPWAESALLTDDEISECQESGMGSYMDDDCKHHSCTEETFYNYGEDDFYEKYPDLKILEDTPNYLQSSDFVEVETALPECESLFSNLDVGFYELTASLEVIP